MATSGQDRHAGYLFGCCAACRAPFVPTDARFFSSKHSQTVLFMVAKFKEISGDATATRSEFSGHRQKAHVVTQAHVRPAFEFAHGIPEDRVEEMIPGWSTDRTRVRLTEACFRMETGSRPGRVRAAPDASADASVIQAVREARERIADGDDPDDVDREIVQAVSNASSNVYRACWDAPAIGVQYREVSAWLEANDFGDYSANLDRTLPFCRLCNTIWDCFSRMSLTLRHDSVIPPKRIRVFKGIQEGILLPDATRTAQVHTYRLGCMVAYFLHGCLRQFHESVTDPGKWDVRKRDAYLALGLLPLHAYCMYEEMNHRASGLPAVKGAHNYLGCLDVIISQFLYVMASIDPEHAFAGFPFERFHVFYMKELAECPPQLWDPRHKRVHDFVFDDGYAAAGTCGRQVSYASTKLLRLYTDFVKPLVDFMVGNPAPPVPTPPEAARFFLTHEEADALVSDFLQRSHANIDNLAVQLDRAGSCAILWQLQRGLREEDPRHQREVELWLRARMHAEWKNIAANRAGAGAGTGMSMREAQVIYLLMHTRDPSPELPAVEGPQDAVVEAAEESADDPDDLFEAMRAAGRCSMWKAAQRLRAWNFTREAPPRPVVLEDEEDDSDEDGDNWRAPGRLRPRSGLHAQAVKELVDGLASLSLSLASPFAGGPTGRKSAAASRRPAGRRHSP